MRADVGVGSAEYTKEGAPLAYGKNRSAPSEEEENSTPRRRSSGESARQRSTAAWRRRWQRSGTGTQLISRPSCRMTVAISTSRPRVPASTMKLRGPWMCLAKSLSASAWYSGRSSSIWCSHCIIGAPCDARETRTIGTTRESIIIAMGALLEPSPTSIEKKMMRLNRAPRNSVTTIGSSSSAVPSRMSQTCWYRLPQMPGWVWTSPLALVRAASLYMRRTTTPTGTVAVSNAAASIEVPARVATALRQCERLAIARAVRGARSALHSACSRARSCTS